MISPKVVLRSLVQRVLPERRVGLTNYYVDGFPSRLEAANWQMRHHASASCLLEVGCGRDLCNSVIAAVAFGKRVIAFDVSPLIEPVLVNFTLEKLGSPVRIQQAADLEQLGIRYVVAPSIEGISGFDGMVSTAVFEHVPVGALEVVFRHGGNIMGSSGLITAVVDYRDHWSYVSGVGPDHFYYVGPRMWSLINNRRMWQNRMRHPALMEMAKRQGFAVLEEIRHSMPTNHQRQLMMPEFQRFSDDELSTGGAWVAWRKAPSA